MPNELKENIVGIIKLFLLFFMMINGFFITYAFIWFLVGSLTLRWCC